MSLELLSNGLVVGSTQHSSPNYQQRTSEVRLIVLHAIALPPCTSGTSHIIDFFQNKLETSKHEYFASIQHLKVSAHFLVSRTGEVIQFVSTNDSAWHCGNSIFRGRTKCNDFSLGIELEGWPGCIFTEKQYKMLAELIFLLQKHYDVTDDRIVAHSDIAPGRKFDPGDSFDWQYLFQLKGLYVRR